ncbi:MAG: hypothetical protein ACP6IY_08005 [Promethearchaeia archaeon]
MENKNLMYYSYFLTIGIIITLLFVSNTGLNLGNIYPGDDLKVDSSDIFSGSDNHISIKTNNSVGDVDIFIGDELVEHTTYNVDNKITRAPTLIMTECGSQMGSLSNLEDKDGKGITITPKRFKFACLWHYYYLKTYIILDVQNLNLNDTIIKYYMNSTDLFQTRIYYYNFDIEKWTLIDNNPLNIEKTFNISENMTNGTNIILKLTCYSSLNYFKLFIDKFILESRINSEFEGDLTIDVSDLPDGYYNMTVKLTTLDFKIYYFYKTIYVDNTSPKIINATLPAGQYNDTTPINFSATIIDHCKTNTFLEISSNDTSYTITFGNSTEISYSNYFKPGNYSYSLVTIDSNGLINITKGNFTVLQYEGPPNTIIADNTISVSVPLAIKEGEIPYPVLVEVKGAFNYTYKVNITYTNNNTVINNGILNANESIALFSDIINKNFSVIIRNLNKSNAVVFNQSYIVSEVIGTNIFTYLGIFIPSATQYDDFNIVIDVKTNSNSNLTYELYNAQSGALISSGNINGKTTIYLNLIDNKLSLYIYDNGTLIYRKYFKVSKLEIVSPNEKENQSIIDPILLVMIASLVATVTFGVLSLRKKDSYSYK